MYLVSCSGEDDIKKEMLSNVGTNNFNVTRNDVEKVVSGYLNKSDTRSFNKSGSIVGVDSICIHTRSTRGVNEINNPNNLLFFVRLSDGSTVVVAGDKRAEPIYAHIDSVDLKFRNGQLIGQKQLPGDFLFMLGVMASSVYNKITTESSCNPHWACSQTRSSKSSDEFVASKCKVEWGQGDPFNLQSPSSTGDHAINGRAAAGCVPIALAQALTVLKSDFGVFKGYTLKTSWRQLKSRARWNRFYNQDERTDISNVIKRIAENIGTSYHKDGFAGTDTKDAVKFLGSYLGGQFSFDTKWDNTKSNMKNNAYGLSIFSGHPKSNGWLWKRLGIDMPSTTRHCMLLDGYKTSNGTTLYYINFGWDGCYNGYYLYDDKTWFDDAYKEYEMLMKVYNFHIDTDYDDF